MQQKQPLEPLIISIPTSAKICATSRQNIYNWAKYDPTFPRIVKLGKRKSGIFYPDLLAWARKKARTGGGIEK
jgi:predicted DNA-binding transcriptional regulator AlpA